MHKVQIHAGAISKLLMICASLWEDDPRAQLKLVDYLPVQTHKHTLKNTVTIT